ncbi:CDP-glucose 4,6-dehydratase [Rhodovulum bhavnagarense]|uniref:CDP-glucose 4,6-dehydratase n=1 Tax=Rhodovulum bhavnagarense TaxID=992286 RepID=A0A4V2SVX6_9RHOB|nr:CDP-glucose 4,6-dehydratase [Rhodovulum bhavnagarense]TCP59806.1 CDP-glucose 4,6-dehydratase [Rhodovulum bhavnagarense]
MGLWAGKQVLLTGHTGFKGAWLAEMLLARGAGVFGLALPPDHDPALFDQLGLADRLDHAIVDLRDRAGVAARVAAFAPDMVFHLAAQPLVQRSYRDPVETWATNVMGTVHLLDALRIAGRAVPVVVVTTDKVYENREWVHGYRETDRLGGHDPYSASKAACELVAESWRKSFGAAGLKIATVRAGNVIGGGDWSENRLIPDLARAFAAGQPLRVRNPAAIRPWQHVLEPLSGYLLLAERLMTSDDPRWQDAFNFGPEPGDLRAVRDLVEAATTLWPGKWIDATDPDAPHEAGRLSLTIDKARTELGWAPRWDIARGLAETVTWYRDVTAGADAAALTRAQIAAHGGAA